jgi:hypothetical protein
MVKAFSLQKNLMFPSNGQYIMLGIVYHICKLWKVSFIVQTMEVSQKKKKKHSLPVFLQMYSSNKYAVLIKETLHFRRGESCHDSTHTILHTPALFLYDLDQVQLEKSYFS